ncbi:site-specific integrase [Methylobacterium sp.]|uniref:site-specific integrase n=1 Tax=Methylobacterium sp. TaxID=409 RepID=UPI003C74644D
MAFADRAREYADQARSTNTRRAYASDVRAFMNWCEKRGEPFLPASPAAVLAYLIDHAVTLKVTTLQRHLAAIRDSHTAAGHVLDTSGLAFRDAWRGIKRTHGQPAAKKRPLMTVDLRKTVVMLPDTLSGVRDRAILLVGFAAALRRSELANLEVVPRAGAAWVEETGDGLVVHLGRSKTDQQGEGVEIGIPYGANPETCPVRNYRAWVHASGIKEGAAFRAINRHGQIAAEAVTDRTVARIVQRSVEAAALAGGATIEDAARLAAAYSGHSLRSGLATSAAANDAPGYAIQKQLRHKRFDTTSGYIRSGQLFKQNPAGMAGL